MSADTVAQADADHRALQQLADTLGLKDPVDDLHSLSLAPRSEDLQGLVQASVYEPSVYTEARLSPNYTAATLSPGRRSPGRLSLPTSDDLLRTPPLPSRQRTPPAPAPGSQAVVAAMRALQERVSQLTHDNIGLAAESASLREQVSSLQAAAQREAVAGAERDEVCRGAGQATADAGRVQVEQARELTKLRNAGETARATQAAAVEAAVEAAVGAVRTGL